MELLSRKSVLYLLVLCRTDSKFAPSQWETSLQSNTVSLWLGANLESALVWPQTTRTRAFANRLNVYWSTQDWNYTSLPYQRPWIFMNFECAKPFMNFALWFLMTAGRWFNMKMSSYQYRKSHCGDKTILRPSYLHNGISYTGKMPFLYWFKALISIAIGLCNRLVIDKIGSH